MQLSIMGIVGRTMFVEPFYGGDNIHEFPIPDGEYQDLLDAGVAVYPNRDHIDCQVYGKTYEEYLEMCENWEKQAQENRMARNSRTEQESTDLPF